MVRPELFSFQSKYYIVTLEATVIFCRTYFFSRQGVAERQKSGGAYRHDHGDQSQTAAQPLGRAELLPQVPSQPLERAAASYGWS